MLLLNLVLVALLCKLISSKMQDFVFDVNDILSDKLMPVSLMLLEGGDKNDLKNLSQTTLDDEFECATKNKINGEEGTFTNAFSSMGFHRKMINNFLCSKFIAGKILDDIQPAKKMKNRLGIARISPETEFMANNSSSFDGVAKKSHMLYDEGSYEYKNWLAKSTTLNDIYRTLGMNQKLDEKRKLQRQDQFIDDATEYKDEYEEGDVTGFMVEKPLPNNGINSFDHFSPSLPQATAGAKTGKVLTDGSSSLSQPSFHDLQNLSSGYHYGPTAQQDYQPYGNYQPAPQSYHPPPTAMKSIGIKDLFDIALTTLAFLSFGMFIIQVIMCITMAKGNDNSVMLPMEMTADGGEVEAAELEVRVKRAIEEHSPNNIKQINDISKRTLQSIEAFVLAKDDRGQCLKKFICENNKFSRQAADIQRYTIPIFGISLSYLSNKLNNFPIAANLDDLKASLIGLGNGNCSMFKCSVELLIARRK